MNLSYHHANPRGGNESFLLRFQSANTDSPTTILVDAGAELELDRILSPGETIDAVCLTHAHSDHYQSLNQCVDPDTSVYTSPATAKIIGDVFDIATQQTGVEADDSMVAAIEPVDEWTSVGSDVAFHPVPAGHVPGAVGTYSDLRRIKVSTPGIFLRRVILHSPGRAAIRDSHLSRFKT
ncbi:MBL fold metallo-hydrolase [Halorubrum sp. 2020YC2]|nr:MBL fold metallo-hydrolase [Halorubrum sp. 2020YC2]